LESSVTQLSWVLEEQNDYMLFFYLHSIENDLVSCLPIVSYRVSDDILRYFSDSLMYSTTLSELHFVDNGLGDDHILTLSSSLAKNTSLTVLRLNHTEMGIQGTVALKKAFEQNSTITDLDIRNNKKIGGNSCVELVNLIATKRIIRLFGGIPVSNKRKEYLLLNDTGCSDCEAVFIARLLSKNNYLQAIDIRNNYVTTTGFEKITKALDHTGLLSSLDVRGSTMDEKTAKLLADAVFGQDNVTYFSGINIKMLKDNELSENIINLRKTRCGDAEAIVIGSIIEINTVVTDINLWDNNVTDIGVEALTKGLKENKSVLYLKLQNNNISGKGAKYIEELFKMRVKVTHDPGIYISDSQKYEDSPYFSQRSHHQIQQHDRFLRKGEIVSYSEKTVNMHNYQEISFYKLSEQEGWIHNFYNSQPNAVVETNSIIKEIYLYLNHIGFNGRERLQKVAQGHPSLKKMRLISYYE